MNKKKLFSHELITSGLTVSHRQEHLNLGFDSHKEMKIRLYKKKK